MAFVFYYEKKKVLNGVQQRLICSYSGNNNCGSSYVVSPILFHILFVGCFIGVLSALVMSCNKKQLEKWIRQFPCIITISCGLINSDGSINLCQQYYNDELKSPSSIGKSIGENTASQKDIDLSTSNPNSTRHKAKDQTLELTVQQIDDSKLLPPSST